MRLWYQSMSSSTMWPGYTEALARQLDRIAGDGTTIEIHGIEKQGGIGDNYRYLEHIETREALDNVDRATRAGFDAFLIGNIGDPGLREARELTDIPVLGLCETSCHVACMMGWSFSIVAGNRKFTPRVLENIARYGLQSRLAAVNHMDVARLAALDDGFGDDAARADLIDAFNGAAAMAEDSGAEVIIPAVGVFMTLLSEYGVNRTPGGIPILNGVAALVKMGETAVQLSRLSGIPFTSKYNAYAPPPDGELDELRTVYGPEIFAATGTPSTKPGR